MIRKINEKRGISFSFLYIVRPMTDPGMSEEQKSQLDPQKWVERHGDYLFNYAVVRINDREKAEDLVQETFLSALKAAENFKGKSSERTWLISILKRKIIDTYRKRGTSRESSVEDFGKGAADRDFFEYEVPIPGHWNEEMRPHSRSLLPEGGLEEAELMRIIEACIAALPPNLAAAFVMKLIDEAESEDICKELGITPSNLWVMLHRARLKMRKCVEARWTG